MRIQRILFLALLAARAALGSLKEQVTAPLRIFEDS
jgi:hypothetical protein